MQLCLYLCGEIHLFNISFIQDGIDMLCSWFRKWHYVKEFKVPFRFDYTDGYIYIHLYESDRGKRKFEISTTHQTLAISAARKKILETELYHERIVRWLAGRHDAEIPKFSECDADDTFNVLRGSTK